MNDISSIYVTACEHNNALYRIVKRFLDNIRKILRNFKKEMFVCPLMKVFVINFHLINVHKQTGNYTLNFPVLILLDKS